jgi:hypothetical protein
MNQNYKKKVEPVSILDDPIEQTHIFAHYLKN